MIIPNKIYNGKVELIFDEFKHSYFVEGERIPSVTSILSIIAKPALIAWAANMATDFIMGELKPGVGLDEIQLKTMFDLARKAHTKKKQDAADIGTFVHNWISDYINKKNPPMPVNEQLLASVQKFLEWKDKSKVQFLLSEQPVYSVKHKYAGTLDFIAKVDGELMLGDIKTSSGIYDEYWFQTSAYQYARMEEYPEEKYGARGIIRIGKDGSFEWKKSENYERDLEAFVTCRKLWGVLEEIKKEKVKYD